jgi:hypothetical protein
MRAQDLGTHHVKPGSIPARCNFCGKRIQPKNEYGPARVLQVKKSLEVRQKRKIDGVGWRIDGWLAGNNLRKNNPRVKSGRVTYWTKKSFEHLSWETQTLFWLMDSRDRSSAKNWSQLHHNGHNDCQTRPKTKEKCHGIPTIGPKHIKVENKVKIMRKIQVIKGKWLLCIVPIFRMAPRRGRGSV